MPEGITVNVKDIADELGVCNTLVVGPGDSAVYTLRSNGDMPDFQEIGMYAAALLSDTAINFLKEFDAPELKSMPDHSGQVLSGETMRSITVRKGDAEFHKLISMERQSSDYYVQRIQPAISTVKKAIVKHPVRALHMEVQWPNRPVQRGKGFTLPMTLTNPGTQKAAFVNPLAGQADDEVKLEVYAQRSDIDLMNLREGHYVHQAIGRDQVRIKSGRIFLDNPTLELAPKTAVTLELSMVFDWPPGVYSVQLKWEDVGNRDPASLLSGVLYSSKHTVIIEGASKPSDADTDLDESEADDTDL